MNVRDEQRVIDALRAYTGGITVTDQDINLAESRFRETVEPPAPRRRLVVLAVAAAAVLVAGFFAVRAIDRPESSPAPAHTPSSPADHLQAALQADAYGLSTEDFTTGAQPTLQDLAGFWMLRDPYGAPMYVGSDGRWQMGSLKDSSWGGTSSLTASTWTRHLDDSTGCAEEHGQPHFSHAWRAAIAQDGSLRLQLTRGLNVCTPAEEREVWDRVGRGSPIADYLLTVSRSARWQAAPSSYRWLGLYLAPRTGHLLEVSEDGTYQYYDTLTGAPLLPAVAGELRSTGSTTTGSCPGGSFSGKVEHTRIPGVDGYVAAVDAVRIAGATSGCDADVAAEGTWVNIFR